MAFPLNTTGTPDSREAYTLIAPYEADNGSLWYWDDPRWVPVPVPAVTSTSVLSALNTPSYANLAAANVALAAGQVYYDEELETLNTATT